MHSKFWTPTSTQSVITWLRVRCSLFLRKKSRFVLISTVHAPHIWPVTLRCRASKLLSPSKLVGCYVQNIHSKFQSQKATQSLITQLRVKTCCFRLIGSDFVGCAEHICLVTLHSRASKLLSPGKLVGYHMQYMHSKFWTPTSTQSVITWLRVRCSLFLRKKSRFVLISTVHAPHIWPVTLRCRASKLLSPGKLVGYHMQNMHSKFQSQKATQTLIT